MPLDAIRIQHQLSRRPLGFESLERLRLFLDMGAYGDEVRRNGLDHVFVRIDLGLQPSTSTSHGRRAEVDKNRLARSPRLREARVGILEPFDRRHLRCLLSAFLWVECSKPIPTPRRVHSRPMLSYTP